MRQRALFAEPDTFAWFARAGLDVVLDALAAGDCTAAERAAFHVYRQAAYVEALHDRRARGRT